MDSGGTCITAHRNTIHASFHSAPKGRPDAARVCLRSFWAAGLQHLTKSPPPSPVSVSHTHANFQCRVSLSLCVSLLLTHTHTHTHTNTRTHARAHTHTHTHATQTRRTPISYVKEKEKRLLKNLRKYSAAPYIYIYIIPIIYDGQSSKAGYWNAIFFRIRWRTEWLGTARTTNIK